ncbi:hypothetical protein L9F63_004766 [Diploptera punctata]|uniref:DNA-directed primase/polymerase protein n=1 Tax=Diploptera punctata TaxID=6984 RepID=A0AAD8E7C9_DIPPU|nr:hypothetical protein L9F63_004766 [Diploptera punctata]
MDKSTNNVKEPQHFTFGVCQFYGKKQHDENNLKKETDEQKLKNGVSILRKWPRQLDLTATWKIFKKQQGVLEFIHTKKSGLMAFAFQDKFGQRLFLAAHPVVFWFYDTKRNLHDRHSYEIITEHSVCKLYFDLEFNKEINSYRNGNTMTDLFIRIVCYFIREEWGIVVSRQHVFDLDSTTVEKFSRHLVFIIPNVAFEDNYNVGNFVKYMCYKIREYINDPNKSDTFCGISKADVSNLLVVDRKGSSKLFCDEAVYTKNRHFRLYMSTKQNKTAPLVLSDSNQYNPSRIKKTDIEQQLFLDSLITYFNENIDNFRVLKFISQCDKEQTNKCSSKSAVNVISNRNTVSPYPQVDKFINDLVSPGKIWRWFYFSCSNLLAYDIVGYRYCGNIGREHRSNNIKYIVNLENFSYYQKCHDPDCSNFRSAEYKLPLEVIFFLEDDNIFDSEDNQSFPAFVGQFGLLEEEFVNLVDAVECIENDISVSNDIPDYGISDRDLCLLDDLRKHD